MKVQVGDMVWVWAASLSYDMLTELGLSGDEWVVGMVDEPYDANFIWKCYVQHHQAPVYVSEMSMHPYWLQQDAGVQLNNRKGIVASFPYGKGSRIMVRVYFGGDTYEILTLDEMKAWTLTN